MSVKHVNRGRSKELRHKKVGRIVINLLGFSNLLDNPLFHHHNHVGYTHCLLLVVGDEYGGDSRLFLNTPDFLPCLQTKPGVKVGKGLVKQKHSGHFYQRPGNCHTLLLSPGKLAGLAFHQLFNLDKPCGLFGLFQHFGL